MPSECGPPWVTVSEVAWPWLRGALALMPSGGRRGGLVASSSKLA